MADRTNEELLDELIRRARLSVGKLTKGEACAGEYAAVLARMAGPGEVVVPVEIDRALPEWQASDSSQSYWAKCLAVLRGPG